MQLTNDKLTGRAERMVMDELQVSLIVAQDLLKQHQSMIRPNCISGFFISLSRRPQMTSLQSLFTLYSFDIFFKPKYDFELWANQNFYIRKVSIQYLPIWDVNKL